MVTPAIRNLIREGKTHQIYSALQAGAKFGMQTMDTRPVRAREARPITYEAGLEKCHHPDDFKRRMVGPLALTCKKLKPTPSLAELVKRLSIRRNEIRAKQ